MDTTPMEAEPAVIAAVAKPRPATPAVGAVRRYYVLVVLTLVSAVSILDRQIMSIMVEPIRRELGLADTQMGLLTGVAFGMVYVTLCIPVARFADRLDRGKVVGVAVTTWSLMTMLCGAAGNFWQLFAARFGVGFGEAGGAAPAQALLGDLFPRSQRATVMSVLTLCSPIGMGLGLVWGGWALHTYGWRTTFVMAGIPGLVLAPLVLFTFPKVRAGMADGVLEVPVQAPFLATLRTLWSIRTLPPMVAGATLATMLAIGFNAWVPAFLTRSHGLDSAQIGAGLGAALGLGSLIGHLAGGPLVDVLGKRDLRWQLWVAVLAVLGGTACAALAFVGPVSLVFPLLGLQALIGGLFSGPLIATTVSLAPVEARATALACLLFVVNGLGFGLGPQVVGTLSDLLKPSFGTESLRIALLCSTVIALPAALLYFRGSRSYAADLAVADARADALSA